MRPRLFLSYARTDVELADHLAVSMEQQGCRVWLDRNEILTGDDFIHRLNNELARSDGLVALMTEAYVVSEWCKAELQRALGLGKQLLIVQRTNNARFPDAIERLLRDIHRTHWTGDEAPDIASHVARARSRRRARFAKRWIAASAVVTLVIALAAISVSRLNEIETSARRSQVISELQNTDTFLSRGEIDVRLSNAQGDTRLPPDLHLLADDPTQSLSTRHNAWQALTALRENRQPGGRIFVPEVDWRDGVLRNTAWSNHTYSQGRISGLEVENSIVTGIVFGRGPDGVDPGLSIINSSFKMTSFWFLVIDATQLLSVRFEDSKFHGAQIDLAGHAGVRFITTTSDTPHLITDELTVFRDSLITQSHPLPGPDVLDLSSPESEILFEGAVFERVRFEGHFKPEWFRKSYFEDCVFATELSKSALMAQGNQVEGGIWVQNENLDNGS